MKMIKQDTSNSPLIFVLYDGINNSIFDGQVLQPLIKHKKNYPDQAIIIISFEKQKLSHEYLKTRIQPHIATIICFKKFPFFGSWSLCTAINDLKKYLMTFPSYSLLARGPLAGYICVKALQEKKCLNITIQIRGLLAAEYSYEHAHEKNIVKKWWHQWRAKLYDVLEQKVYSLSHKNTLPIHFEAVSKALKEYLITRYKTPAALISVAQQDIPQCITSEKIQEWRAATRAQLNIAASAKVYCYNGSLKSWQCPEKTIEFFKKALEKDSTSFFLVLTQEVMDFEHLMHQREIPKESYIIMRVPHIDIYHYLAACDVGLIFREDHIINWISRPTKILEYQAVNLPIIHNNTIAMLSEK